MFKGNKKGYVVMGNDNGTDYYISFSQVDSETIEVYAYDYFGFSTMFDSLERARKVIYNLRDVSSNREFDFVVYSDIDIYNLIISECDITLREVE